jgi:hypothetical protein
MLSEKERRQFDEIVRDLLADSSMRASFGGGRQPATQAREPWRRRLVTWADRRFRARMATELGWLGVTAGEAATGRSAP